MTDRSTVIGRCGTEVTSTSFPDEFVLVVCLKFLLQRRCIGFVYNICCYFLFNEYSENVLLGRRSSVGYRPDKVG